MSHKSLVVAPGPTERVVRTATGELLAAPLGWVLLPPGDPGLTRRVKAAGPSWTVTERKGRKTFSHGVWAPGDTIERLRAELEQERADPRYERKLEAGRQRRERAQDEYSGAFEGEVVAFLAFAPRHAALAERLALAITRHATPVGSGTVARTQRIPIAERAEAATIAWLRHQTTGYDQMHIPRVKGMRREVRRLLAQRARELLQRYRRDEGGDASCPLRLALARAASPPA